MTKCGLLDYTPDQCVMPDIYNCFLYIFHVAYSKSKVLAHYLCLAIQVTALCILSLQTQMLNEYLFLNILLQSVFDI